MQHPPPNVQRDLFQSSPPLASTHGSSQGAGRGVAIWFIAAASLVIGILIGFATGYTAGRRAEALLTPSAADGPAPPAAAEEDNAFTEGTVAEPVRVDPEPIVPEPEPPAAVRPESGPQRAPMVAPRREPPAPVVPAAAERGSLQILSRPPGAEVTLDGRVVGRTPLVISDVRIGRHDVRLELTGFRPWATSVRVEGTTRTRVAASLEQ